MAAELELARDVASSARRMFGANVRSLTLEEALSSAGGYRSILGVIKHIGGWARVYRSYAFDAAPRHWDGAGWPGGLRDTIEASEAYLRSVVAWADEAMGEWDAELARVDDISRPRPLHWGGTAPLAQIVVMHAQHVVFHTGELNMLLSIARDEAWEYSEEVEENHISTYGHGVRPEWMGDEEARRHEQTMAAAHARYLAERGAPL